MSQIDTINRELPELLALTEFTAGNRYEDFNSSTDSVAKYGLAALVAGGIAAKSGLLAKLGVLLFAFKKFIIIGLLVIGGVFSKIFGRKSG